MSCKTDGQGLGNIGPTLRPPLAPEGSHYFKLLPANFWRWQGSAELFQNLAFLEVACPSDFGESLGAINTCKRAIAPKIVVSLGRSLQLTGQRVPGLFSGASKALK